MTIKCTLCDKEVADEKALQQHKEAKHPERVKKAVLETLFTKKTKTIFLSILVLVLFLLLIYWFYNSAEAEEKKEIIANITATALSKIPSAPTHWHPELIIIINNKTQPIPAGIGVTIGKVTDIQYGMDNGMAPTHTHSADGVIHLENLNPQAKPETFALGYFFYIWNKELSKSCIFNYCTDTGTLTMTVNGVENKEFENYVMQDGDKIVIEYTSFGTTTTTNEEGVQL